ncbi:MAG TPA: YcjX family protein [Alphaproteobacteria bacterium]|nr:YcjX family protein [Alphaproteobacteria bacterium]
MDRESATDGFGRWIAPVAAEVGRQLRRAGETALSRTVRLAVTGLARSGKTVLTAALVQNLLLSRERPTLMPFFEPAHERRLWDVRRLPPRRRPSFPFDSVLQCLSADPPIWPPSTSGISELRLAIDYRPRGLTARLIADRPSVTLVIVDYPGEWLLDLPLLERSYEAWSAETLGLARTAPRAALAQPFLSAAEAPFTNAPPEAEAERLAELYTDYLRACRARQTNLSFVQPGRFLLPGREAETDPRLLRFAPLPPQAGRLGTLMAERYESYKRVLIEPFFRDHFRRFDRQLVLVDLLSALESGYEAFRDAERALNAVLSVYRYGRGGLIGRLFGARIDKVLFAATKADHITPNQYNNLRALLEAMAMREGRFPGLGEGALAFGLIAAMKCTEPASLRFQGRPVEALRGIPEGSEEEQVLYPGEIPTHYPTPQDWREGRFRFVDFLPPRRSDPLHRGVRAVYLDKALDFLVGDRFR